MTFLASLSASVPFCHGKRAALGRTAQPGPPKDPRFQQLATPKDGFATGSTTQTASPKANPAPEGRHQQGESWQLSESKGLNATGFPTARLHVSRSHVGAPPAWSLPRNSCRSGQAASTRNGWVLFFFLEKASPKKDGLSKRTPTQPLRRQKRGTQPKQLKQSHVLTPQ